MELDLAIFCNCRVHMVLKSSTWLLCGLRDAYWKVATYTRKQSCTSRNRHVHVEAVFFCFAVYDFIGGHVRHMPYHDNNNDEKWMTFSLHIYVCIHAFIHSLIHSCIHSFSHSFIHSFSHSFIHSAIHSLIHSFCIQWSISENWKCPLAFLHALCCLCSIIQ